MTAKEFLEQQASGYKFTFMYMNDTCILRPRPIPMVGDTTKGASAYDLLQLAAILTEAEYSLEFMKDNSIHIEAPHKHKHAGHGPKDFSGWSCTHGLTKEGCEAFNCPSCPKKAPIPHGKPGHDHLDCM